jgi:DNA topoisomerase-6 subunit B
LSAKTKPAPQPAPAPAAPAKPARRQSAEEMSKRQKSIAVSEFFYKNRHLLGFDNPRKALLTTVKEAVDNSLDACEEAGILPDIEVRIEMLAEDRYRVVIGDNGPGIVAKHVGPVFGKLLYGSKFHRLKMSRGQQGIGISAAGMYAMMTTGKNVQVLTRTGPHKPAYFCELQIDTKTNEPVILREDERAECPFDHGTQVTMELQAKFHPGRAGVGEYLEQTAIANPHAKITYRPPIGDPVLFARGTEVLPPEATEIKPHPYGVELGTLLKMLQDTSQAGLVEFLTEEFCKINVRTAKQLIAKAGLRDGLNPHEIGTHQAEPLYRAIQETAWYRVTENACKALAEDGIAPEVIAKLRAMPKREFDAEKGLLKAAEKAVGSDAEWRRLKNKLVRHTQEGKLPNPPTDCLAPIGARQILAGLLKEIKAEFFTAETREPAVYRGMPFQIEVGLAYGGELAGKTEAAEGDGEAKSEKAKDDKEPVTARLVRFANRVPLLYQQSACVTYKAAVEDVDWKRYGLTQPKGALPVEPLVILIHMASVWVPFTSESKEAIADYDAIRDEIKLALQECARKLQGYIRRRERVKAEGDRRNKFRRYLAEVVAAVGKILGGDPELVERFRADLEDLANKKTERADLKFDQDGNVIKAPDEDEAPADENTIIVDRAAAPDPNAPAGAPASEGSPAGGEGAGDAPAPGGGEGSPPILSIETPDDEPPAPVVRLRRSGS